MVPEPPKGLDWVKLRDDMDHLAPQESPVQRLIRRATENPFVPFGAAVTVGALSYGLISFVKGRQKMSQNMMRLRVGAQFFTIAIACIGIIMNLPKEKRTLKGFIESGERKIGN